MKKSAKGTLAVAIKLSLALGSLAATGSAFAQDNGAGNVTDQSTQKTASPAPATKTLNTVEVTGSRIRGVDIETAQPVVTITQADIRKTGLTDVGDILQNLTIAGQPTFSKSGDLLSNSEQGGQYANLYNLGENRTLVLVNGKRWTTSLLGFTDMSNIPAALIDHIEVLKDGASSLYGSDAIAGVINIVLNDHYEGAELNSQIGQQQGGDGVKQDYAVTFGTSTDKSSIVFAATYSKTDPVYAKSRDFTSFQYGPDYGSAGLSGTGPWGRVTDPNTGDVYVLNHTGGYDGQGVGADSRNIANYHVGPNYTDDYYNTNGETYYQSPDTLKSLFTSGSYKLTDNINFKATGMYSERDSATQVAGYPFNTANLVAGINPLVQLSGDSYYNPFPGQDVDVARRTVELPRLSQEQVKSLHFDGGFDGEFQVNNYTWNWDTDFDYNKYDVDTQGSGNLNLLNLQKALGPSFLNSAGTVQCGTAAAPISGCTPFNILGGPSASTPAALNYINALEQSSEETISKEFTANLTGGLFEMPLNAGTFSFAAGIDHRAVSGYQHPDELASEGYTTDLVSGATQGSYTINEAYLEFQIPVLKDLPGAKALSFDVATRYSHYSNFGSTTNNKYSFEYTPFDDLKLRGTFAHGFRAPTINDLYGGGSQSFDDYTDPCDVKFGSTGNAAVAKNCAAAGLSPTNFRQLNTAGAPVTGPENQSATPFYNSAGNTALKPELSTTRTVGLVYSPHFVDGLDFELDHYDIKINNVITGISADYTLQQCYQYSVQSFCSQFSRDPVTGQVIGLREGTTNLGSLETTGYTLGGNYRLPQTSFGLFKLSMDVNYLDDYITQSEAGAQKLNTAGQYGSSRWRINAGLDWSQGNWGATWGIRYYGSFLDECFDATDHCNKPNYTSKNWADGPGADRIGVVVMNDVQGRYTLPWGGTVSLGIRDLFDRHPPLTFTAGNNTTAYYDPTLDIGRYIYLQYNQKF